MASQFRKVLSASPPPWTYWTACRGGRHHGHCREWCQAPVQVQVQVQQCKVPDSLASPHTPLLIPRLPLPHLLPFLTTSPLPLPNFRFRFFTITGLVSTTTTSLPSQYLSLSTCLGLLGVWPSLLVSLLGHHRQAGLLPTRT